MHSDDVTAAVNEEVQAVIDGLEKVRDMEPDDQLATMYDLVNEFLEIGSPIMVTALSLLIPLPYERRVEGLNVFIAGLRDGVDG
jgi:hypothetical protein